MSPSANLLSGDVAERYAIEGEVGRGGTAIVYRARDRVRGTAVAIKLLREDAMSAVSVERFMLEIRQTAQLPHPHIVPVLDSGEINGRPYFVLPFLEGGTLRDRLKKHKQLPFEDVIAIGTTVARALEYAHSRGVIHRDVKPENILFNDGQACLADFGTARALERAATDPTTSTGVVRGTAAYMSPEQASGEREYDGRTDIYSLACVLYECVAGIQPFVGPTMQAIISQRLTHTPRPVSVYRPTVSPELEQVLARATAMSPADRFVSAKAFADALDTIPSSSPTRPMDVRARTARARRLVVGLALGGVALLAAWLAAVRPGWGPLTSTPIDTTLIAILPVETTGNLDPATAQELFIEGLSAWSGVSAVEAFSTNDAIRRKGRGAEPALAVAGLSVDDAADVVRGLGAGRFIRSHLDGTAGLRGLYAALYDVRSGQDLYHARLSLPADSSRWPGIFAALADSLVLRGASGVGRGRANQAPRNLASYQLFLRGRDALATWDLAEADSLFRASVQLDSLNTRAMFWSAQVAAWRNRGPAAWSRAASVAANDSVALSPAERAQARALAALGQGNFEDARRRYADLTRDSPYDFAAWYGLGTAYRADRVVVKDPSSRSGYRFRASYEQAIKAYSRAFELLPSAHRTIAPGGFELLRAWLFTTNSLRAGSETGRQPYSFYASVDLDHDTVVFVPYLRDTVLAGPPQRDPSIVNRALTRNRRIFQRLVSGWRESFPAATGTREAVAISMEMLGDPAAPDSLRAIRQTAPEGARIRLAVNEVLVRLKLAISDPDGRVDVVRQLADSVLDHSVPASDDDVELLARLAVITGRCARAAELARRLPSPPQSAQLPPSLVDRVQDSFARWAAGCGNAMGFPAVASEAMQSGLAAADASRAEYELLGAPIALEYPVSERGIRRLAAENDYVLTAEVHLLDGDTARARHLLGRYRDARFTSPPGGVSPDAMLSEARLWLAMGDSTTTVRMLDKLLSELRFLPPMSSSDGSLPNMLRIAAVTQAVELRARIGVDEQEKQRWAGTLASLWATADAETKQRVARIARGSR